MTEAHPGLLETSKMEYFATIFNGFSPYQLIQNVLS